MVNVMAVFRFLCAGVLACALYADITASTVQQARDLYYQGIYGDKDAGEKADDLFAKLHRDSPDHPLISVYFGSLRLLEAQHTWALWKKNSLSKEGIQLMDEAVKKDPESLEVRFVRAATERSLPSFFGRKEQAASDLQFIVQRAAPAAQKGEFEPRLAAASFFYYGEWCRELSRLPEAKRAWRMAVNIAPESNGARKSSAELDKLEKGG